MTNQSPPNNVIKVISKKIVTFPSGATHYAGDLREDPVWWKYYENSTGTVKAWFFYRQGLRQWMLGSETKPNYIRDIQPTVNYQD